MHREISRPEWTNSFTITRNSHHFGDLVPHATVATKISSLHGTIDLRGYLKRITSIFIGLAILQCPSIGSADETSPALPTTESVIGDPLLQKMITNAREFAIKEVRKNAGLWPFGETKETVGPDTLDAIAEDEDSPTAREAVQNFVRIFNREARRGHSLATAIVFDATTTLPSTGKATDAIAMWLDEKNGASFILYFPYQRNADNFVWGEPFLRQGYALIFPRQGAIGTRKLHIYNDLASDVRLTSFSLRR